MAGGKCCREWREWPSPPVVALRRYTLHDLVERPAWKRQGPFNISLSYDQMQDQANVPERWESGLQRATTLTIKSRRISNVLKTWMSNREQKPEGRKQAAVTHANKATSRSLSSNLHHPGLKSCSPANHEANALSHLGVHATAARRSEKVTWASYDSSLEVFGFPQLITSFVSRTAQSPT